MPKKKTERRSCKKSNDRCYDFPDWLLEHIRNRRQAQVDKVNGTKQRAIVEAAASGGDLDAKSNGTMSLEYQTERGSCKASNCNLSELDTPVLSPASEFLRYARNEVQVENFNDTTQQAFNLMINSHHQLLGELGDLGQLRGQLREQRQQIHILQQQQQVLHHQLQMQHHQLMQQQMQHHQHMQHHQQLHDRISNGIGDNDIRVGNNNIGADNNGIGNNDVAGGIEVVGSDNSGVKNDVDIGVSVGFDDNGVGNDVNVGITTNDNNGNGTAIGNNYNGIDATRDVTTYPPHPNRVVKQYIIPGPIIKKKKVRRQAYATIPFIPAELPKTLVEVVQQHYDNDLPTFVDSIKSHWPRSTAVAYSKRKFLFQYIQDRAAKKMQGGDDDSRENMLQAAGVMDQVERGVLSVNQFSISVKNSSTTRKKRQQKAPPPQQVLPPQPPQQQQHQQYIYNHMPYATVKNGRL